MAEVRGAIMSRIRTRQCHRVVGRSVALRARRCACQARPALWPILGSDFIEDENAWLPPKLQD